MHVVSKATYLEFGEAGRKLILLNSQPTNQVIQLTNSTTDYTLFPVSTKEANPSQTTAYLEDHPFVMEMDTGAAVSLINETTYKSSPFLKRLPLQSSSVRLRMYTGSNR